MRLSSLEKKEYDRYIKEFDFTSFLQDKTFLITGSKGMTGRAIVKWILYENMIHNTNAKIYASTRCPESIPDYIEKDDNIEMCQFDKEEEFIGSANIDYVIHAASPTERNFFVSYPAETLSIIIEGTKKMLDLAKKKEARFILLSSVEVYGIPDSDMVIQETCVGAIDSLNIRNGYPLGKKGAEFLTYSYFREYYCDTRIARISAIQGLYQEYNEQRIFNEITRCVLENKNLVMKSNGESKKSIVYTLDAVSGILTVLFRGEKGEVYNITNPQTYISMKELAEKIFNVFNPQLEIEYDIMPESITGYLPHLSLVQDVEKIGKIGWKPITSLEEIYRIDIERWKNEKNGREA